MTDLSCTTCKGNGKASEFTAIPNDGKGESWNVVYDSCPDCDGSGVAAEAVEAAALAMHVTDEGAREASYYREMATVGLAAVREEAKNQ